MKTKKIILFSTAFIGLAVAALPLMNRANTNFSMASAATSVGDQWFSGTNCSVETFLDKGLTNQWTATGFTTELTPTNGAKNVRATLNMTLQGAGLTSSGNAENMFVFEKYLDDSGNVTPTADMIVFTLKSATDPTKSVSIINRLHYGVWNAVGLSFTEDIELHDDGYVYLKGTEQPVLGSNKGVYDKQGCVVNSTESHEAPLFGCDYFYLQFLADGTIQHNAYRVYGNIKDENFLNKSREFLLEESPYYNLYTPEYAQSIVNALSKPSETMLTITYYGVKVDEPLAFRIRQLNNVWLGDNVTDKTPSMTKPFVWHILDENFEEKPLYTGFLYHITDLIEPHNAFRPSDGINKVDLSGWNDVKTHNDSTWFANNSKGWDSKGVKLTEVQEKGFSVYTRCTPIPESWSDRYLYQDIYFNVLDGTPVVTPIQNPPKISLGQEVDIDDYFTVFSPDTTLTKTYFVDNVQQATSTFIGDGLNHTFKLSVKDSSDRVGENEIYVTHIHDIQKVPGKAETCKESGYKDAWKCSSCSEYYEDEAGNILIGNDEASYIAWKTTGNGKIPPHAHPGVLVPGVPATCSQNGYKDAWKCSECSQYFSDKNCTTLIGDEDAYEAWKIGEGKLPISDHNLTKQPGIAPTCGVSGYKDAWKCNMCNQYFSDATGKSLIGDEAAYKTWKTSGDGMIPPLGHKVSKIDGVPSTCSSSGYKDAWKCSECKKYFEDEACTISIGDEIAYLAWRNNGAGKLPPSAHSLQKVDGVPATCEEAGYKDYYKCSVCNDLFEDIEGTILISNLTAWKNGAGKLSPLGHSLHFVEKVPATKENDGVMEHYECDRCDKLFVKEGEQYIEKKFEDLIIKYQPSGCGGSVIAASATLCGLALAGVALILVKRKKDE